MSSYSVELGNGDRVLVHGADNMDGAWDELVRRFPEYTDEDYEMRHANPDMGESQTLQYDHVIYA